ncbi:helix-turn-helix transcriptional regulator [Serratia plymuthica]|uniref:XRE family transcriptional regulator n=1 Tax=Serratia plymuthica TaxID=82996 RepID=UPI001927E847|nr:helix-turn-helix transcriptional regulator [Serratia plymuthica]MBL3522835.1 helix-turn-helix transcriptional regulator [Serratia plymuthica]
MKMTLAQRMKVAMSAANVTQSALADKVRVSQAAIQKIASGKAKSSTKIVEIAAALGVRPEWLGEENGPMKEDGIGASLGQQPESNIGPESEWGSISTWDHNTPLPADEVEVPFLRDIELAAGDGSFSEDDYNGFKLRFSKSTLRRVGADTSGKGVICFPAHGDSMEPIIPDGTTVAVDTGNKKVVDGKIYAINQDGLKRIKQLYRMPGGKLIIHSFNRDDDETADEADVEIIGRVFWYSVIL